MPEDYLATLRERYDDDFTDKQYAAVGEVLDSRFGDEELSSDAITLESGPERVVIIQLADHESPLYADPDKNHGVGTGIKDLGVPPEGKTKDGSGNDVYGVR